MVLSVLVLYKIVIHTKVLQLLAVIILDWMDTAQVQVQQLKQIVHQKYAIKQVIL